MTNIKQSKDEITFQKLEEYYNKIKGKNLDDIEAAFVDFWTQKKTTGVVSSDGEKVIKSVSKQLSEREKIAEIAKKAKEQKQKEAEKLSKSKADFFDFVATTKDENAVKILTALLTKRAVKGQDAAGVYWEYHGTKLYENEKEKFGKTLVLAIDELIR